MVKRRWLRVALLAPILVPLWVLVEPGLTQPRGRDGIRAMLKAHIGRFAPHDHDNSALIRGPMTMASLFEKVPQRYSQLHVSAASEIKHERYEGSIKLAEEMYALLPPIAKGREAEAGLKREIEWRVGIADLKANALDYHGAMKDFAWALKAGKGLRARIDEGRVNESLFRMQVLARPDHRWDGYPAPWPNQAREDSQLIARWVEASVGPWRAAGAPDAESRLAAYVSGHTEYLPSRWGWVGDGRAQERARAEAAFLLGELYLNRGDGEMARLAYTVAASREYTDPVRRMAGSRLLQIERVARR